MQNLVGEPQHGAVKARLAKLLADWTVATGDFVPERTSQDLFDRETGATLKLGRNAIRGTPPGWERQAARLTAPGPR